MTSKLLQEEIKKSTFDVKALAQIFFGSSSELEKYVNLQEKIASEPLLRFHPEDLDLDRTKILEKCSKMFGKAHELIDMNEESSSLLATAVFAHTFAGGQHTAMFQRTIKCLGTDEQINKWIPLSKSFKVFGCYAQTEIGHGSDVQGLETTSTYDPNTEEFVINTPTLEAVKWWIGDLGIFANHAMVFAQLIVNGKKYGVHSFIVPIRDMQTHETLPNVHVGDVGPKYGFNGKDNGFLKFNNVRVPRDNMMMRFSKIKKTGEYIRVGNEKVGYATMLHVRCLILSGSIAALSQALTITVRYSLYRTQFKDHNNLDKRVLDYQLQGEKLFPLLAYVYINQLGVLKIKKLQDENLEKVDREDFSLLSEIHPLLSAAKAVYTWDSLTGVEKCRLACGGHGFSSYSGLPIILTEFAPNATYEGENTVLMLQTARYLVKNFQRAALGKEVSNFVDYLKNPFETLGQRSIIATEKEFLNLESLRIILRFNAVFNISTAAQRLQSGKEKGLHDKENWDNHSGIALVEAAFAHFFYWNFNNSLEALQSIGNEKVRQVLTKLAALYAISKIYERPMGLFESGYFSGDQIRLLRDARERILGEIRSEAAALVEVFHHNDNTLKSGIGLRVGKAYETMFDWVQNKNNLNKPGVHAQMRNNLLKGLSPKL